MKAGKKRPSKKNKGEIERMPGEWRERENERRKQKI